MEKKYTAGKWMGIVAFILSLVVNVGLITGFIIQSIYGHNLGITIEPIVRLTLTVFVIVWSAVFGSGLTKKILEIKKEATNEEFYKEI